jgi:hypothetical protein
MLAPRRVVDDPAAHRAAPLAVALVLLLIGAAGASRAHAEAGPPPDDLVVQPAEIDFGDVARDVPRTHDVKVKNVKHGVFGADFRITGVTRPATAECAPFQLQAPTAFPVTMSPGQEMTWHLTMRASALGHHTCTIDVRDDDGNADYIRLSANVVAPRMTVQPAEIDFGDVAVNDEAVQRIAITNDGTAPLSISSIAASGAAAFSLSDLTAPETIPVRTTRVLTVAYQPSAAGAHHGAVTISGDDGTRSIPLTGTGIAAEGAGAPIHSDVSTDPASYYGCSHRGPVDAGGLASTALVLLFLLRRARARAT